MPKRRIKPTGSPVAVDTLPLPDKPVVERMNRKEMAHALIVEQFKMCAVSKPVVDPYKAFCYGVFKHDTAQLNECLNDAELASQLAAAAAKLNVELNDTIMEVIWKGGNIDPVPFEKEVRQRFSRHSLI